MRLPSAISKLKAASFVTGVATVLALAACAGSGTGFTVVHIGQDNVSAPHRADLVSISNATDDRLDALRMSGLRQIAVLELLGEQHGTRTGGLSGAPKGVSDGGLVNGLAGIEVLALVLENQHRVSAKGLRGLLASHPELRRLRLRGSTAMGPTVTQSLMVAFPDVQVDFDARIEPPEPTDGPTELPRDG